MTPAMIDINDFTIEELRTMVLAMQQRMMFQLGEREMDMVRLSTLQSENTALKRVLADRIVGLLVHPTADTRPAREFLEREGEATGEDGGSATTDRPVDDKNSETQVVTISSKDKEKFQA